MKSQKQSPIVIGTHMRALFVVTTALMVMGCQTATRTNCSLNCDRIWTSRLPASVGSSKGPAETGLFPSKRTDLPNCLSSTIACGEGLYDAKDYCRAVLSFRHVIAHNEMNSQDRRKAEFWLAKSLFHLGYYSVALSHFEHIVDQGPQHRYFDATLKWLVSLRRTATLAPFRISRLVGHYPRSRLETPALEFVRGEALILHGRGSYLANRQTSALESFRAAQNDQKVFAEAKIQEAILHARAGRLRLAEATLASALQKIRKDRVLSADAKRSRETRLLQNLARVNFAAGKFKEAICGYRSLLGEQTRSREAFFISSWSHLEHQCVNEAQEKIERLRPYRSETFAEFPEAGLVKVMAKMEQGRLKQAKREVSIFLKKAQLVSAATRTVGKSATIQTAAQVANPKQWTDWVVRHSLTFVPILMQERNYSKQLHKMLGSNQPCGWADQTQNGEWTDLMRKDLRKLHNTATANVERLARRRLERVRTRLEALIGQATELDAAITRATSSKLDESAVSVFKSKMRQHINKHVIAEMWQNEFTRQLATE
jgi:tetratricopeptide (TPR) repeat protein